MMTRRNVIVASLTALASGVIAKGATAETYRNVPAGNVGFLEEDGAPRLAVRRLKGPGPAVVYVHGATFSSALSAGWRIGGRSWMDVLAEAGFDAWSFDFIGYGSSARPPVFDAPSDANPPVGRMQDAGKQLLRVLSAIRKERPGVPIVLLAHSWGSMPAHWVAGRRPDLVQALIMFGPPARRDGSPDPDAPVAWFDITEEAQRARFRLGIPSGDPIQIDEEELIMWSKAYLATDPFARMRTPPAVRVPSGPGIDAGELWSGRELYDLAGIRQPVLLVRGAWDIISNAQDIDHIAQGLSQAARKSIVTIPRATHLMHLEYARTALWDSVNAFLRAEGLGA